MSGTSQSTTGPRRRALSLVVFATLCAAVIAGGLVSSAMAGSAKVLGKTKNTPPPSCPNKSHPNRCQGVGRVTGFPLVADGQKRPFLVRKNGKLVAWAVDTSRVLKKNPDQQGFFETIFKGGKFDKHPSARIAVIKQNNKHRRKFKLLRQSPTVNLSGNLGRKSIFTLDKPLRIRKGQTVALTIPSWITNFAHANASSFARNNKWRASRSKKKCSPTSGDSAAIKRWAQNSKAQQKVGSSRNYGCDYSGGRLLYWAYYVPK
ncbi:MAG TPA: hypothetical protein VH391_01760 [Solirubrobacterales bacterium]|jgi:hypothetical protein